MLRELHRCFPGKYKLEIVLSEEGNPFYQTTLPNGQTVPMGLKLAQFRQQLGGEEGETSGPQGDRYQVSTAQWADHDPEKTYLQLTFGFTPNYPYYIDPALYSRPDSAASSGAIRSGPPALYLPVSGSAPPRASKAPSSLEPLPTNPLPPGKPSGAEKAGSSSHQPSRVVHRPGLASFINCSDVRHEHRLTIRPGWSGAGQPAAELLKLAEASAAEIECPVCEGQIKMYEPLEKRINEFAEALGDENALMQLIMAHPADLAETKTPGENNPLLLERYYRYSPIYVPPPPKLEGIERRIEAKSQEHLITIRSAKATGEAGIQNAAEWLKLPQATQLELECPLCDTELKLKHSLEEFIKVLAELLAEEGEGQQPGVSRPVWLEWSISHPATQPETKSAPDNYPFKVGRHPSEALSDRPKAEGYPGFVVLAQPQLNLL